MNSLYYLTPMCKKLYTVLGCSTMAGFAFWKSKPNPSLRSNGSLFSFKWICYYYIKWSDKIQKHWTRTQWAAEHDCFLHFPCGSSIADYYITGFHIPREIFLKCCTPLHCCDCGVSECPGALTPFHNSNYRTSPSFYQITTEWSDLPEPQTWLHIPSAGE